MVNSWRASRVMLLVMLIMMAVLGREISLHAGDLVSATFFNPDSYYKLVMVGDVDRNGFQYVSRDNAPYGVWMHWSMPHTWVIWVFHNGLAAAGVSKGLSLLWAGGLVTLLSVLVLALLSTYLVLRIGSPLAALAVLLALAMNAPVLGYGQLTQITHHIFMLVPVAAAAACLIVPNRGRRALADGVGGMLLGLALWISPETMLLVTAMAAIRAAIRLQHPDAGSLLPVAGGLLLAVLGAWLIDPPPPTFSVGALDHVSLAWLLFAGLISVLLILTEVLDNSGLSLGGSVLALALAASTCAALWLWAVPGAMAGPAGLLPAELRLLWWDRVQELQPVKTPVQWAAYLIMPLVSGACLIVVSWRRRSLWMGCMALTVLAYALLGVLHIRMGAAAGWLASIGYGIALGHTALFTSDTRILSPRAQLLAAGFLLLPTLQMITVGLLAPSVSEAEEAKAHACSVGDVAARLNDLPPGVILVPINNAPEILYRTHHQVVSGNYHHNIGGMLDYYHFWRDTKPEARAMEIVRRRSVDYVLGCSVVGPDLRLDQGHPTLAVRVGAGERIDGLHQGERIGAWWLYRVD